MANEEGTSSRWKWVVAYALIAFLFWGVRPLWESTEARYAEVARGMVASGDWLIPRVEGREHLTKPPLAYWVFASGIRVFGANEWGARFGQSVVFFGAMCAVAALARVWGRGRPGIGREAGLAGLIFGTGVVPFAAGHYLTTDMTLTLFEVLFVVGVWRVWKGGADSRSDAAGLPTPLLSRKAATSSPSRGEEGSGSFDSASTRGAGGEDEHATPKRRGVARGEGSARSAVVWRWVCWISLGLAFETKGPPGLLPLLAVAVFALGERWLAKRGVATALVPAWRMWSFGAVAACVVISAAWFVAVAARTPGALDYFLKGEILDRLFRTGGGAEGMRGAMHARPNGVWVYPATILGGVFPWVFLWPQLVGRTIERARGGWRGLSAEQRFTVVWFVLALTALCLASSRMPLYALPLFAPLSVWGARVFVTRVEAEMRGVRWIRWSVRGMWAAALVVMLGFTLMPDEVGRVKDGPPSYRTFARKVEGLRTGVQAERVIAVGAGEVPLSVVFGVGAPIERVASISELTNDRRAIVILAAPGSDAGLDPPDARSVQRGVFVRHGWAAWARVGNYLAPPKPPRRTE